MLVAKEVSFYRGSRQVLAGISGTLRPGRVTALLGPNGAGKSTLVKLLTGELEPAGGSIELDGRALGQWPAAELGRRRAVLPQEARLAFAFPVREVVMMGRMPHDAGGETPRDAEICAAALERVEAGALAERLYTQLSGGEKQRVQLARVLAQVWEKSDEGDRYLMLDEPTASLDLAHQHGALLAAAAWAKDGTTVLAVLHDLNLAMTYADDAWVLDAGRLVASGPVEEVLTPELIGRVFQVEAELLPQAGRARPWVVTRPRGGRI
jgi:iron complex transport system ATP-binding protein